MKNDKELQGYLSELSADWPFSLIHRNGKVSAKRSAFSLLLLINPVCFLSATLCHCFLGADYSEHVSLCNPFGFLGDDLQTQHHTAWWSHCGLWFHIKSASAVNVLFLFER